MRRWGLPLLLGLIVLTVCGVLLIRSYEKQLIYGPIGYPPDFTRPSQAFDYRTSQGTQTAFYFPPSGKTPPRHLWVMFGGHSCLALPLWRPLINAANDPRSAFLLIDYPGFGLCEGSPTPARIDESTLAALAALEKTLGAPRPPLRAIGYSLGTAVALRFSALRPDVEHLVLIAPFTDLDDMARELYGIRVDLRLRRHFDNRAALTALSRRPFPPRVFILHGENDEAIPVRMGRELAANHPTFVSFHASPRSGHDNILGDLSPILRLLRAEP